MEKVDKDQIKKLKLKLKKNKKNKKCKKKDNVIRGGSPKKKLRKFGPMSKPGLPYLPSSLVWTKKSLDMYSNCLPYLPIQKVWTILN